MLKTEKSLSKVGKLSIVSIIMLVVMSLLSTMTVNAEKDERIMEDGENVIDEKWGQPVYVYGDALTEKEAKNLAKEMGYNFSDLEVYTVSGEDMVELLGEGNKDSNMYSSVIIERSDDVEGINVEMPNEERITKINQTQYENAMTTSGVSNAKVVVDSPAKVTGESALTGIFKAYEEKDEDLDKDRMELGQDELNITSDINEENKGKDEYDVEELNAAITDIKQRLSELEEGATKEEVKEIVDNALDERDLLNVMSENSIERLVDFAEKYRNSSAIDSEEVKQQLEDISKDVADKVKDIKDQLDESGFWDKLKQFFIDLFNAVADFF